ncbi:hypothetical protein [Pectobacterium versatile]|uniref:hypothetical protein n=1 Tax=Pectobacterium versatile TaxID=2488639 RepID=UPI001FAEBD49|nr:hypothetical protein [Pectobacterium versatile]
MELIVLENYFFTKGGFDTSDDQKRAVAVAAALEIARASAAATSQRAHSDKVRDDLDYAASSIAKLADAIQDALRAKSE